MFRIKLFAFSLLIIGFQSVLAEDLEIRFRSGESLLFTVSDGMRISANRNAVTIDADGSPCAYSIESVSSMRYVEAEDSKTIPASDEITFLLEEKSLTVKSPRSENKLDIFNSKGQIVVSKSFAGNLTLGLNDYAPGLYIVKVNGLQSFKINIR